MIVVLLYDILFCFTRCSLSDVPGDLQLVVRLVMAVHHCGAYVSLGAHCFLAGENLQLKGFPSVGHVQL